MSRLLPHMLFGIRLITLLTLSLGAASIANVLERSILTKMWIIPRLCHADHFNPHATLSSSCHPCDLLCLVFLFTVTQCVATSTTSRYSDSWSLSVGSPSSVSSSPSSCLPPSSSSTFSFSSSSTPSSPSSPLHVRQLCPLGQELVVFCQLFLGQPMRNVLNGVKQ